MKPFRIELDPEQTRWLLDELSRRLTARGVSGTIRVAGGAAMALNFPDDPEVRVTSDIDAVYEPKPEIDELIAEMATEFDLPPRWLNSSGAAWLRVDPPSADAAVGISIATPLQLVAMKLAASREQDLADLKILARHLDITDPDELVDVAYREYGEDSVELADGRDSYRVIARAILAQ